MHPALLAAATAGHHAMLPDMEQVSRQYPAAVAMSSYRGATALPVCTGPHVPWSASCMYRSQTLLVVICTSASLFHAAYTSMWSFSPW